nr:hypothetical protein [Corynebacterium auriscanis]
MSQPSFLSQGPHGLHHLDAIMPREVRQLCGLGHFKEAVKEVCEYVLISAGDEFASDLAQHECQFGVQSLSYET